MTKGEVAQNVRGLWKSPAVIQKQYNFYVSRMFSQAELVQHDKSLKSQLDTDSKTFHGLLNDYIEAYPVPKLVSDKRAWEITAGAALRKDAKDRAGLVIPAGIVANIVSQKIRTGSTGQ